jgi:hypothetical protein
MHLSRRKLSQFKQAALAILAAAAPLGAAGAVATLATTPQVVVAGESSRPLIADSARAREVGTALRRIGIGPGVHRLLQRPLTGLEIRAVRLAASKRCVGTNRTGRSKYVGDGVPARITKIHRNNAAILG